MSRPLYSHIILGPALSPVRSREIEGTLRSLVLGMASQGHEILYLERREENTKPLPFNSVFKNVHVAGYRTLNTLMRDYQEYLGNAESVMVTSGLPQGLALCEFLLVLRGEDVIFYDLDADKTLDDLQHQPRELNKSVLKSFLLYLCNQSGRLPGLVEEELEGPLVRPMLPCIDTDAFSPAPVQSPRYDLGSITHGSPDEESHLRRFLLEPVRRLPSHRFSLAGANLQSWSRSPDNLFLDTHSGEVERRNFYTSLRFYLDSGSRATPHGYHPSIEVLEAAACGVPALMTYHDGLHHYFDEGEEMLICRSPTDVVVYLMGIPYSQRLEMCQKARRKVQREHSGDARARQLFLFMEEAHSRRSVVA